MWNRIAVRILNKFVSEAMKICINAQQLLSANLRVILHCLLLAQRNGRNEKRENKEQNAIIGQIYLFDFNWKWIRICLIGECYLCSCLPWPQPHRAMQTRWTWTHERAQTTTTAIDLTIRAASISDWKSACSRFDTNWANMGSGWSNW